MLRKKTVESFKLKKMLANISFTIITSKNKRYYRNVKPFTKKIKNIYLI